jgi:hypothetical protein
MQFLQALHAETLKLRRTLCLWMILIAPAVIAVLQCGIILNRGVDSFFAGQEADFWLAIYSNMRSLWLLMMLPLFITLESALLASVEHNDFHWKHLFTLPQPRWTTYMAKWVVLSVLTLLASLMVIAYAVLVGWFLALFSQSRGLLLSQSFPLLEMLKTMGQAWLISWWMMAIHTWVSLYFRSFTVAVGVGMAAAVSNLILINSEKAMQFDPWLMQTTAISSQFGSASLALGLGVSAGLATLLAGMLLFTRRDVL